MADCAKINPEIASHNVAAAFSNQFVESISSTNKRVLDLDGAECSSCARTAAQLYAIAYDAAFEYFSNDTEE